MNSGIETVTRNSRHELAQEGYQAKVAEQRDAWKEVLGFTLIGFGVVSVGSMLAWMIVEAIQWMCQSEASIQSTWAQKPFW
jgi:hypothetical protein